MPSYAVVGASRGIGLGFVKKLSADPKNTVFALVRNPQGSPQLQEFLGSGGNRHKNVHVLKLDLIDSSSIKTAAEAIAKENGGALDILINNGALLHDESNRLTFNDFADAQAIEKNLLQFFQPNVIGIAQTIQAFLPLVRKGQQKKILVVTSSMGSPAFALDALSDNCIAYSTSKAALNMIVAKYALACKDDGVIFLSVSPGLVKTMPGDPAVVDKLYEDIVAQVKGQNPRFRGLLTIEQSVDEQLALLARTTLAESGSFLHSSGTDANLIE